MEDNIEDGVFICHGCFKKCELVVENQSLHFGEICALNNIEKWEAKKEFPGVEFF